MTEGLRQRRAAVALGESDELVNYSPDDRQQIMTAARRFLEVRERWLPSLGRLVLENTGLDLSADG